VGLQSWSSDITLNIPVGATTPGDPQSWLYMQTFDGTLRWAKQLMSTNIGSR